MLTILTSEWWTDLHPGEQTFWGIALISTTLFVLQTIIAFTGLEGDFEAESQRETDFKILSVRSVIAFFTFFSWGGVLVLNAGMSINLAVWVGMGFGLFALFFVAWILFKVANMMKARTENLSFAIGLNGEVFIPIPGKRNGKGKIQIIISQNIKELDAITDGAKISTGEKVLIVDILPNNVLVVKKEIAF